jgi:DNA-binding HxlR family transcriptional regulator
MHYQRKRDPLDPCPVELVVDIVGGKWKARILLLVSLRPHSFAELRRALPKITQQVLSAQLRSLTEHGILQQERAGGSHGPRSIYSLTPLGEDLMPVLEVVAAWGEARLREQGLQWMRPAALHL